LGFEEVFKGMIKEGMNGSECMLVSKERPHISKAKIDRHSNAKYIVVDAFEHSKYTSELDERYIAAPELSYDLLFSMHDVNSRRGIVYRTFQDVGLLHTAVKKDLEAFGRKANIEARVIGLQNGQDFGMLKEISDFIAEHNIRLVEVDLFGNSVRHVAIDTKLGMSLNILMENRIYRPGELVNNMTLENFEAALTKRSAAPKRRHTNKAAPKPKG
jgi:hypothetical protein